MEKGKKEKNEPERKRQEPGSQGLTILYSDPPLGLPLRGSAHPGSTSLETKPLINGPLRTIKTQTSAKGLGIQRWG